MGPPSRVLCAPGGTDGRCALEAAVVCGPRAAHARRGVTLQQHPRGAVPPTLAPCQPQYPPSSSFLGASRGDTLGERITSQHPTYSVPTLLTTPSCPPALCGRGVSTHVLILLQEA